MNNPKDFRYAEAKRLLESFGYQESKKGATAGSRVTFYHKDKKFVINLHKPHPDSVLKTYVIRQIIESLKRNGDIDG